MNERRRYRILAPIARGSFGTVYRAEMIGQGGFTKQVALKVLNPELTENEEFTRRLRDEARLLALIRHRAIVAVDGLVELDGRWTVVMEYIEGADLKTLLNLGPVPAAAALDVTAEIAAALHITWNRKGPDGRPLRVLHRDLKPSNIRITPAGEVKVLDFGVARADFDSRESETRNLHFGSAAYMSPERIDFVDGPEGDIYAVGSMLYEMLAGQPLGKTTPDPKRHATRLNDGLARLWATPQGRGAAALGPLLTAALAYEAAERPRARDLERRCLELGRKAPGLGLRDWAERAVGASLPQASRPKLGDDDLSGRVIEETLGVAGDPGPPAPPPSLRGLVPASPVPPKPPAAPEFETAIRPMPELPEDEDSGDEDTDQGADGGWGARAHLSLPEISEATPRLRPIGSGLGDEATQVRIAPPPAPLDDGAALGETVGLVADSDLLSAVHDEPSGPDQATGFLTQTLEQPGGAFAPTVTAAVPRGRDAPPLVRAPKEKVQDDGAGWVIGILLLGAIGFLVFTYMPEDGPDVPTAPAPQARPGDLPGQAWNPEGTTLRGQDANTTAPEPPAPAAAPPTAPRPATSDPAATPTPAPADDTGSGTVRATGFASQIVLIGGGQRLRPGTVPAGRYRIEATFPDGSVVKAGQITVTDGSLTTLHCSKVYKTCRVE